LNRKAFRGGAAVMGAEIISSFLRIGAMIILARLLLPEDFGLLAMVTALTMFTERFMDMGLSDATVQSKEINHDQVSNLFWINLAICVGIALTLSLFSKAIAWFYDEPRLIVISLFIASTFVFSGLVIQHQAVLRRQLRFAQLSLIQLCSVSLSLLLAIILAYYGFGYWALVAREFSRTVFVVIGTWFVCPWQPGLPRRGVSIANLLSFAKNVTGFNMVYFFSHSLDKILIGKLQGPYWVGLYTNAFQLMALPVNQIQYPINTVTLPALSALQTAPAEFRAYSEKMMQLLTFLTMPAVVFVALFGDAIVSFLLGPKWINAVPIFRVLAIGVFVEPLMHAAGPALVAYGKTREYFRMGVINSLTLLCCLTIGSPWGAIGIAIGYSISIYLALVVCFFHVSVYTPVRITSLLQKLAPNFYCSVLTALFLLSMRYAVGWFFPIPWIAVFAVAGIVMYLGLWSVIPGGRSMLRNCWNYTISLIPKMKS
jgi:O-antigen/teichoic acid export membrane protein